MFQQGFTDSVEVHAQPLNPHANRLEKRAGVARLSHWRAARPARARRGAVLLTALVVVCAATPMARAHNRDDDGMTETDRRFREKNKPPVDTKPKQPAPKDQAPKETPFKETPKEQGAKPAAPSDASGKTPTSTKNVEAPIDQKAAGGWSIAIHLARGDEQNEAPNILGRIRSEGGLPNAYLQKRGNATLIAVGSFDDPDDPKAQSELKRVQQLEVGGSRPYAAAYLTPPPTASLQGRMPQYNLVRVKAMLGESALYTLQVGAYGREDLPRPTEADLAEARRAAEQAVVQLRQEGEQAFYYHGPRMSMVTVGTFDLSDFDPQLPRFKSSRLLAAQKRHPYNLYNGAAIKEKPKNAPERLQPSNLVAIPSK